LDGILNGIVEPSIVLGVETVSLGLVLVLNWPAGTKKGQFKTGHSPRDVLFSTSRSSAAQFVELTGCTET
jgi:hypothetical protein